VEKWDGMFMFTKILSGATDPWWLLQAASGKLHRITENIGALPRPEL